MQLIEIKEIKGKIILRSGLHIGSGGMEMQIGGTDNPVIKHPHTQEPYIPGSSIKGKVRSLLEMKSGLMGKTQGRPLQPSDLTGDISPQQKAEGEKILKLFASSGAESDKMEELGPTRVSFADCPLTEEWREKVRIGRLSLTEVKSENSINRIRGTAENPRFTERVPAGTEFSFSVSVKVLNSAKDNHGKKENGSGEEDLLEYLLTGLKLLEMDALGGSGSRGYGRIQFEFFDKELNERFAKLNPFGNGG